MQLVSQFDKLRKPIPALVKEKVGLAHNEFRTILEENELIEILLGFAANSLETFFILDGLDECTPNEREKMLTFFGQLLQTTVIGSTYRVLLSSREDINVLQELPSCIGLPIRDAVVEGDIRQYVLETVDDLISKGKLKVGDKTLADDIKIKLSHGAQGMYVLKQSSEALLILHY